MTGIRVLASVLVLLLHQAELNGVIMTGIES